MTPLFEEMEELGEALDLAIFVDACINLTQTISLSDKNELLGRPIEQELRMKTIEP